MTLNIRSKLIIIAFVILFSAIGSSTIYNTIVFNREYTYEIESKMFVIGQRLRSQLSRLLFLNIAVNEIYGFEEQCQDLVEKYPFISYAMVLDNEGLILFHNDAEKQGRMTKNPDILNGLGKSEQSHVLSIVDGQKIHDFLIPVPDRDKNIAATIRIGFPADIIAGKTNQMVISTAVITVLVLIIGIFLFIGAFNQWLLKPINLLMTEIDRMKSSGTPINVNIPIKSKDEIGLLSKSFNDMAAELVKDTKQRKLAESELKKYKDNLEVLVKERTLQLEMLQEELIEQAHRAGMAQIATDTLHNVGNVLNSVKTAAQMVNEIAIQSVISEYEKANQVIKDNLNSLEDFVKNDPKAVSLLNFYLELEPAFKREKEDIISHIKHLNEKIDTIADIVVAQQKHAAVGGATAFHSLESIINDTLEIIPVSQKEYKINIKVNIPELPKVLLQKTKFVHILINLLNNAKDSMLENTEDSRRLTISAIKEEHNILLKISDTGKGIEKSELKKIFSHGYSTKADGHGFGLHSSANYITEMGGKIWAESEGIGKGATFCVTIPTENKKAKI